MDETYYSQKNISQRQDSNLCLLIFTIVQSDSATRLCVWGFEGGLILIDCQTSSVTRPKGSVWAGLQAISGGLKRLGQRALKESGDSGVFLPDDEAFDVAQAHLDESDGRALPFADDDDRHRVEVPPDDRLRPEADVGQAQLEVPLESSG